MEKEAYGHKFIETQGLMFEGWTSTDGNRVTVTPPQGESPEWKVWVPHLEQVFNILGKNSEARAFAIAASFVEQEITS